MVKRQHGIHISFNCTVKAKTKFKNRSYFGAYTAEES